MVTYLVFQCYPDKQVEHHYFFVFLNVNINVLPNDRDTDAQSVQVELNGRHLFCSMLALPINSQLLLIRTRIQSFRQTEVCVFALHYCCLAHSGILRCTAKWINQVLAAKYSFCAYDQYGPCAIFNCIPPFFCGKDCISVTLHFRHRQIFNLSQRGKAACLSAASVFQICICVLL